MFKHQALSRLMRGAIDLIRQKPGLLLLVVVAVVFKAVSDGQTASFSNALHAAASGGYLNFDWKELASYVRDNIRWLLLIFAILNLAASYLSLCSFAITEDASLTKDRSVISSVSRVGASMVLADLLFRAVSSIGFGLAVLPLYLALRWVHAPDAVLVVLVAFLVPLWFGLTACFSFLLQRGNRKGAIKSLLRLSGKNSLIIYIYYASRMLLELVLIGSMTFLFKIVFNAGAISSIISALVLILPLSFFRVSGVLLKQAIFGAPAARG